MAMDAEPSAIRGAISKPACAVHMPLGAIGTVLRRRAGATASERNIVLPRREHGLGAT